MNRLKTKLLCFTGLLFSIFGIIGSLFAIHDLWYINIDLTLKNNFNLFMGSITTFLLITTILLLSIAISYFLEDLKK